MKSFQLRFEIRDTCNALSGPFFFNPANLLLIFYGLWFCAFMGFLFVKMYTSQLGGGGSGL